MIEWAKISKILFIDIETISCEREYAALDPRLKVQWDRKAKFLPNEEAMTNDELFYRRAGIYAEFGKIIVIGLGYFHRSGDEKITLRVKAIMGQDEFGLLNEFKELVRMIPEKSYERPENREKLMTATQDAIDEAVAKEEAELDEDW